VRRRGWVRAGGQPASVTSPCRVQWLDQPSGVTFTTVRRPQWAQYRGGSSFLAARQES
jgi:hypothetical protein